MNESLGPEDTKNRIASFCVVLKGISKHCNNIYVWRKRYAVTKSLKVFMKKSFTTILNSKLDTSVGILILNPSKEFSLCFLVNV